MSLSLIEPYIVRLKDHYVDVPEFISFLKVQMTWAVENKLKTLEHTGDLPETITFDATVLPNDTFKNPKKDSNLVFLSSFPEEELKEVSSFYKEKKMIKYLESLSPESPEGFEVTLNVRDMISTFIKYISGFKIIVSGEYLGTYFGIPQDLWYPHIPIRMSELMKSIDFGMPNIPALGLFYPEFSKLRESLDLYYDIFIEGRNSLDVDDI